CAAQARIALHQGDVPAARQQLVMAQRLRPVLTYAVPYLALQARIELARAHLALADLPGARTLMREVDELLRRRPGLGALASQAQALRTQLSKERGSAAPGASALTDAELRLLPLLATHLTFSEMGQELFLSPNTIKTQAGSIYRKLGASTRSQAVTRARELGLLGGCGPAVSCDSGDGIRPGARCNGSRDGKWGVWIGCTRKLAPAVDTRSDLGEVCGPAHRTMGANRWHWSALISWLRPGRC